MSVSEDGGRSQLTGPNPAIHLNSTYFVGQRVAYGRETNPTWEAFEDELGALEGGYCTAFASGQAANVAVIGSVIGRGRLFLARDTYLGTRRIAEYLSDSGALELRYVEPSELDGEAAFEGATPGDLLMVESPSNPLLNIHDLALIIRRAHRQGMLVSVDSTFATPILQQPLLLGADYVVHSATKYISGHSDILAGAVVTSSDALKDEIALRRTLYGSIPGPFEIFLALRGLKTLALRMERQSASAFEIAMTLASRLGRDRVRYPFLGDHHSVSVARRQMTAGGAMLAFDLGSQERADACLEALGHFVRATSLGGTESLIERRGRHGGEEGASPGLIRASIGLEPTRELLEDLLNGITAAGV